MRHSSSRDHGSKRSQTRLERDSGHEMMIALDAKGKLEENRLEEASRTSRYSQSSQIREHLQRATKKRTPNYPSPFFRAQPNVSLRQQLE